MRWRQALRSLHRWLGVLSAALIVLVTVTGVILHHPRWLGAEAPGHMLVSWAPADQERLLRVSPALLEWSADGGETWVESPLDLVPSEPIRLTPSADGRSLWLVGRDGLLVSDGRGVLWDVRFLPPLHGSEIVDLAAASADRAVLATDAGAWMTRDGAQTWQPAWRGDERAGALALVHDLHTGYWAGRDLTLVYDVGALALLVVVISGSVLAVRTGRRRGRSGTTRS